MDVEHTEALDEADVERYFASARRFKLRRLLALGALCTMLMIPLVAIYANEWWDIAGGQSVGSSWVLIGVGVTACAIVAVLIDLVYRREL